MVNTVDFNAIKKVYSDKQLINDIRENYPYFIDPYFYDWIKVFSEPERLAWGVFRCMGFPFYPQYPVGKYFADFADIVQRVAIEIDGAAYHSPEKDSIRDNYFKSVGWNVVRIPAIEILFSKGDYGDVLAIVKGLERINYQFGDRYRNVAGDIGSWEKYLIPCEEQ